ncbi:MAG: hypothetical protein J7K31_01290 [Candidatus Aenigmarchaeota archaeon]|nr:hypothetical protein [Candidatus Aenigmarchaeota archaeon]
MRKGQMFMIAGILILVGFLMIRNLLSVYQTVEEKMSEESGLVDKQIKNIIKEYEMIVGVGSLQSDPNQSTLNYLVNFTKYLKNDMTIEVLFMYAFYDNTTGNYTVNIGNFLDDKINCTINTTNPASSDTFDLEDEENYTKEFSATSSSSDITLSYGFRGNNRKEKITVLTGNQNFTIGFFDVTIIKDNIIMRAKQTYNRTWSIN